MSIRSTEKKFNNSPNKQEIIVLVIIYKKTKKIRTCMQKKLWINNNNPRGLL